MLSLNIVSGDEARPSRSERERRKREHYSQYRVSIDGVDASSPFAKQPQKPTQNDASNPPRRPRRDPNAPSSEIADANAMGNGPKAVNTPVPPLPMKMSSEPDGATSRKAFPPTAAPQRQNDGSALYRSMYSGSNYAAGAGSTGGGVAVGAGGNNVYASFVTAAGYGPSAGFSQVPATSLTPRLRYDPMGITTIFAKSDGPPDSMEALLRDFAISDKTIRTAVRGGSKSLEVNQLAANVLMRPDAMDAFLADFAKPIGHRYGQNGGHRNSVLALPPPTFRHALERDGPMTARLPAINCSPGRSYGRQYRDDSRQQLAFGGSYSPKHLMVMQSPEAEAVQMQCGTANGQQLGGGKPDAAGAGAAGMTQTQTQIELDCDGTFLRPPTC